MSSVNGFNLIQITDTHIFGNPDKNLAGTDTRETLGKVLKMVSQANNCSYLVVTGDVSMDGSQDSYKWILRQLEQTQMAFSLLPGNHDDLENWSLVFPPQLCVFPTKIIKKPWKLIFLNTQIKNQEYGGVSRSSLSFLQREIEARDADFVAIFMHHPPFSVGSDWIDSIGLNSGKEEFLNLVSEPKVKLVVAGHVHQESTLQFAAAELVTSPSTCVQFLPNSSCFALDKKSPGYRLITLFDDGLIKTGVSRVV